MLQDLSFGTLDNQYRHMLPKEDDLAVCVRGGEILLARSGDKFSISVIFCNQRNYIIFYF